MGLYEERWLQFQQTLPGTSFVGPNVGVVQWVERVQMAGYI